MISKKLYQGIAIVVLLIAIYALASMGVGVQFIFVIVSLAALAVLSNLLLRKLSFAITSKTATAMKLPDGLSRRLLFFIGVPTLMCGLCVTFAAGGGVLLSYKSMNKYGANMSTLSYTAYPEHAINSESGLYSATVDVNKGIRSFTVTIVSVYGGQFTDDRIYQTNLWEEGKVQWAADLDILLVSAAGGEYVYYPSEIGWLRVDANPATNSECLKLKSTLATFKGEMFNGSFYVTCPDEN